MASGVVVEGGKAELLLWRVWVWHTLPGERGLAPLVRSLGVRLGEAHRPTSGCSVHPPSPPPYALLSRHDGERNRHVGKISENTCLP